MAARTAPGAPSTVRQAPAGAPRRRPDPRPMRLALAAGGAATLSGLLAVIGGAALPAAAAGPTAVPTTPGGELAQVRHVVRYVVLAPGELPPTGAITAPSSVVAAPVAAPDPRVKPAVVTSQSGRP